MRRIFAVLLTSAFCVFSGFAVGQTKTPTTAVDFPPGFFTDGNNYHVDDFKGKFLVLYFFEQNCPTCRGKIPERNKVVQAFAGKPVRFIGIAPSATPLEALQYKQSTGLAMPVFADTYGLMEARYGMDISLQNIWQTRIIEPNGQVRQADLEVAAIERFTEKSDAAVKFAPADVDAKFAPLLDLLELGQWSAASKQLTAVKKTAKKGDLASLNTIQDLLKKEVSAAADEAKEASESDPLKAYDLYAKVAATLPADELGKAALKSMKALSADKAVKAELAARTAFAKISTAMSQAQVAPPAGVMNACLDVAKKHAGTPTADKAKSLADELKAQAAANK